MFSFVSLFAGIGGFDLGLERAGMTCKQQVEIDNRCNEVLAHHWPDVQRFGDVRDVGRYNLKAVDLITGGFPCQDVSVAGKRTGLAGERSGLWFEFHRVLEELEPRWVVVENVPGLLSSNGGQDFAVVLRGLVELGYGVCWRVFDAQYDGVAQRRRRVFVVGSLGDGRAAEVLFERESSAWDSPSGRETRESVAASLKAGTPSRRGGGSWPIAEEFVVSRDAVPKTAGGMVTDLRAGNPHPSIVLHALSAHNQCNDPDGEHFVIARPLAHGQTLDHYDESQQTYVVEAIDVRNLKGQRGISGTLQAKENGYSLNYINPIAFAWQSGGDVRLNVSEKHTSALQANQIPAVMVGWHENKQGELTPSNIAKALRAGASHSYQGVGVRRLTPTECERLQGFPDDWTAVNGMKDSPRYRMLGNAVCVPVVEWIGRRIMQVEFGSEKGK